MKDLHTVADLAKKVGLSKQRIYLLIHQKRIRYYKDKYTNKVYISWADWQEYISLHLEVVEAKRDAQT